MEAAVSDYGAFTDKFVLNPISSTDQQLPLHGLSFAVNDIFDVDGHVTGFGNPDWKRTHSAATSTAPVVVAVLRGGATCIGKTIMDEMAYSFEGENYHYGTPTNPCAPDHIPGGSSSGSAVVVGARLVDFSLGIDTGGSVRVPASYCSILGFRPSHGVVPIDGVIPMAQSFDTVGWFARDPIILSKVGQVLLKLPNITPAKPSQVIIADDCFQFSSIPNGRICPILVKSAEQLFGGDVVKHIILGDYIRDKVPSLNHFMNDEINNQQYNIPSLAALSSAMRSQQRFEFKSNHGEWVSTVRPSLGPAISKRVWKAIAVAGEDSECQSVKAELRAALTTLLGDFGVLAIPTVPGPLPKLQTDTKTLEIFTVKAYSLLCIAGMSGFCQVTIPLGTYDNLPVAVSLLAKHGSDDFLLGVVETLYDTLQDQVIHAEG